MTLAPLTCIDFKAIPPPLTINIKGKKKHAHDVSDLWIDLPLLGTCFGISSVVPECVPPSLSVRQKSPHTPSSASHNRPVFRWQTKSADLNPPDEKSFLWWQQNSK